MTLENSLLSPALHIPPTLSGLDTLVFFNIPPNMSKQQELPNYGPTDYVKFFGAGALAATLTHGVRTY